MNGSKTTTTYIVTIHIIVLTVDFGEEITQPQVLETIDPAPPIITSQGKVLTLYRYLEYYHILIFLEITSVVRTVEPLPQPVTSPQPEAPFPEQAIVYILPLYNKVSGAVPNITQSFGKTSIRANLYFRRNYNSNSS